MEGLLDFREQVVELVILEESKNKDNDRDSGTSAPSSSSIALSRYPLRTDAESVISALRELTAFSLKMQRFQAVLGEADQLMVDQSDSLLSRTVQHIKRMFDVTSLEDLLPRMHQMIVTAEQSRNFLNAMKSMLSLEMRREWRDGGQQQGQHSGDRGDSISDNALYSEITMRMRRTLDPSDSSIPDNITGPAMIL